MIELSLLLRVGCPSVVLALVGLLGLGSSSLGSVVVLVVLEFIDTVDMVRRPIEKTNFLASTT